MGGNGFEYMQMGEAPESAYNLSQEALNAMDETYHESQEVAADGYGEEYTTEEDEGPETEALEEFDLGTSTALGDPRPRGPQRSMR